MRSVADELRIETRAAMARLDAPSRVRIALELGDADARTVAAARGISERDARDLLAAARSLGRVPSVANARSR